ncbi:hypothetical protein AGR8A_Cc70439 [Agrobacterium fabrum str. J-07]|nr:hypothetical protein AGR8A_Cc70439 [Agrobacterium fabrum str. J-07]
MRSWLYALSWKRVIRVQKGGGQRVLSGEPKSAVERPGNARKEPCRQTLVVLQHINILSETSEFRSHGNFHSRSMVLRQYECLGDAPKDGIVSFICAAPRLDRLRCNALRWI